MFSKTDLENCANVNEVMEKTELAFIPEKHEVQTQGLIPCPGYSAIVRNDNNRVLSIMGMDYQPIAPVQSFAICDILKSEYGLAYSKAYVFEGGRRISIALQGTEFKLGKDTMRRELRITDSFDGSKKFGAAFGLWRKVCTNGLFRQQSGYTFAIKHTANAQARLQTAALIWAKSETAFADFENKCKVLAQKIVDENMVARFLDNLVGEIKENSSTRMKNQRFDIEQLHNNGMGNSGQTAWDLYNGAVEYYQQRDTTNPEARDISNLWGASADKVSQAFDIAMAVA